MWPFKNKETEPDMWDENKTIKICPELEGYFLKLKQENIEAEKEEEKKRLKLHEKEMLRAKLFVESLDIPNELRKYIVPVSWSLARIKIPYLQYDIVISKGDKDLSYYYDKPIDSFWYVKREYKSLDSCLKNIIWTKEIVVK